MRLYLSHYTADTGKEPSVKVAAHLFKSMCYGNKDRLTAGIICGGWDPEEGGQVSSIPARSAVSMDSLLSALSRFPGSPFRELTAPTYPFVHRGRP